MTSCVACATPLGDALALACRPTHTRHILPPSEIDLGLFGADFADSEGAADARTPSPPTKCFPIKSP